MSELSGNSGQLKPCPFCGSDARVYDSSHRTRNFDTLEWNEFVVWHVECPRHATVSDRDKDRAIAAWNTRAPSRERVEAAYREGWADRGLDDYVEDDAWLKSGAKAALGEEAT